ncbi:LemA family protein [Paratractidigestivibacter sp.]|uniref:LemA family protein n=1 Tax=Paratractidigestivibacter sp. TaxID=2847316 RepID=UPI002ABDB26A|nr:LemA family protein [Paratractidigestivibacter sp.]
MVVALVIIAVIVVVTVVAMISVSNGIVRASNKCDTAWATIDAQLQRRNDLIPNLVETVKGYAAHESATLQSVTDARAAVAKAASPEEKMQASARLTGAVNSLLAVAENYPDLKASANFQQLQAELTDTENRISYARMSYNDCVMMYNNAIQTFPGSLVAGGRAPRQGFSADADARQTPNVQF